MATGSNLICVDATNFDSSMTYTGGGAFNALGVMITGAASTTTYPQGRWVKAAVIAQD